MQSGIQTRVVQLWRFGEARFRLKVGLALALALAVAATAALHWRIDRGEASSGDMPPKPWEHRLGLRLRPLQQSAAYGAISSWTGLDPLALLQGRAEARERKMFQKGEIVVTGYWMPEPTPVEGRELRAIQSLLYEEGFFRCLIRADSIVSFGCRPEAVAVADQHFTRYTVSRVSSGVLRMLADTTAVVRYLLPDGCEVDADQCRQWLDESVAQGWAVHLRFLESEGQRWIKADRRW